MTHHPQEAARLLLSSMHRHRHPDRRRSSFMFNEPGRHMFGGGGGCTEVNFDGRMLVEAALYVQQHGSPHLKGLPVDKVESDLMGFVTEAYYLLAPETFLASFHGSYADAVSDGVATSFAAALAASRFFVEPRLAAIFPLVPVRVDVAYDAAPFFLCAPGGLAAALGPLAGSFGIVEDTFPPVEEWDGRREPASSWLGVRAASLDAARKVRAVVLGAVALLPHHYERYAFSGRRQFGGEITCPTATRYRSATRTRRRL